jgi:hypothetical protein
MKVNELLIIKQYYFNKIIYLHKNIIILLVHFKIMFLQIILNSFP